MLVCLNHLLQDLFVLHIVDVAKKMFIFISSGSQLLYKTFSSGSQGLKLLYPEELL